MPEIKGNWIYIPIPKEEGKHKGHKIRTIVLSQKKGIKALYCVDCKKIITYIFDKKKWTMEEAKKWVEEHTKNFKGFLFCENCSAYIDLEILLKGDGKCQFCKTPLLLERDLDEPFDEDNITPLDLEIPAFVMCPQWYCNKEININNAWMEEIVEEEGKIKINPEKMIRQWFDIYSYLSGHSMVFLLPPKKGLPDEIWVNSFFVVPPYITKNKPIAILSNFTAEGRQGEEQEVKKLLEWLGYECIKAPFKFESPDAKYLRENIIFGGYGKRTDVRFWDWFEKEFPRAKVIRMELKREEDKEWDYHLDCSLFPINTENVLLYVEGYPKKTIKEIEKVANILPVSRRDSKLGICNSVRVKWSVMNASDIDYLKKDDPYYEAERIKNEKLEKYCRKLGLEAIFFNFSEALKMGALLSCCVEELNYNDFKTYAEVA